jgi:type VI secretion system secreted protein Hcp
VTFQDLSFIHRIDKASPVLMKACATGEHIKDATITVRKAGKGQQEYLIVTLTDVMVTTVSTSVVAEGDATIEAVTLAFAKVDLEYKPQKADGSLDAGVRFTHDLRAAKTTKASKASKAAKGKKAG